MSSNSPFSEGNEGEPFVFHGKWLNLASDKPPSIIINEAVPVHGGCDSERLRSGNWISASEGV